MSNSAEPTDSPVRTIAVCGAGIGGLVAAIGLVETGHDVVVLEGRTEQEVSREGVFLTLAPNGMNGLKVIGCHDAVVAAGVATTAIDIHNAVGRRLARMDQVDHELTFGASSVTIGRGGLAAILIARAREVGVDLRFDSRIATVRNGANRVSVESVGGDVLSADILIAADGLRSRVRQQIFPEYPKPHFTGLIGAGAITPTKLPSTAGVMRMTFGARAFFGYLVDDDLAYWFTSYVAESPTDDATYGQGSAIERIRRLHAEDPDPNPAILADVDQIERTYPIYDLPALPAWSRGRVVLLGDAAHAVGPHAGQGASMAIEDGLVLTAALGAEPEHGAAFARYERARRPRVAEVVKLTSRNGSQKRATSRWQLLVRDLVLPIFIPFGIRAGRRLLEYRVDLVPLDAA